MKRKHSAEKKKLKEAENNNFICNAITTNGGVKAQPVKIAGSQDVLLERGAIAFHQLNLPTWIMNAHHSPAGFPLQ